MSAATETTSSGSGRRRARRQARTSLLIVTALAAGAAAGGATAGCHPTGTPVLDPVYGAIFAALVTVAASRASRWTLLVLGGMAAALSRDWLLVPGAASLLVAFGSVFPGRSRRRVGALVGALAVQVVLRWPHVGFQGLTAILAAVAVIPCLISAVTHLSRRWRRVFLWSTAGGVVVVAILAVPVVVGALAARPAVTQGISAAEGALNTVTHNSTSASIARLDTASSDLAIADRRAAAWWTEGGRLIPIVAQQRQAIAKAVVAGKTVTAAAAHEASTVHLNTLTLTGGQLNLATVRSLDDPVDALDQDLTHAQAVLAGIRSPWLVKPITSKMDRLDTQLTKAQSSLSLAAEAIKDAPALLGGDGVRHYFVAFMTPAESRGLGGYIGTYAELTVNNGKITIAQAGNTSSSLNAEPAGSRHITGPADYLANYGRFDPQDFFGDLSYAPDLPTDTQVIAQMFPQSGGDHIDGVLALDPAGLAPLLNLTGPLTVPGSSTPLTAANVNQFLLEGQYADLGTDQTLRHDFLLEAMTEAFDHLLGGSLPAPQTLADELGPQVKEGNLLFWSTHPADQPLLRRLGLAGAFPQTPGKDVLAVTTQNAGNNKLDAYLQRTVHDQVTFDPATGQTDSTVTITLHNSAPASGLPTYVAGSYSGSGLPPATNRTWLSVYSPLQLEHATEGDATLPTDPTVELGVNSYSTYLDLAPGQTQTVVFQLAGRLDPGEAYSLTVWHQPAAGSDPTTISVSGASGWTSAAPAASSTTLPDDLTSPETVRFRPAG